MLHFKIHTYDLKNQEFLGYHIPQKTLILY